MRRIYLLILFFPLIGSAQQLSSSEIFQKLKKLSVLGNVLYLAAHPDDENTRFISYCANEKLVNTAYLSLTRGDGGQNLIGTEIREELGIIRTQELLAARKIDGGKQYFTRANDFGYSKTPLETLKIWDKDKVLSDVVWVIRKFRPDIIVCRFPIDGKGGHGHHTSSALLAEEAFDMAADTNFFSEQLKYVDTWQAKRVVINTGRWWNKDISASDPGVVALDIGGYNTTLGISYNEMAALSRSMHKTQGFGSTGKRGEYLEYFEYLKGDSAKKSLFENIDFTWSRIVENSIIEQQIKLIQDSFDIDQPSNSINQLIKLRKLVLNVKDEYWKRIKLQEINQLILHCAGVFLEATTLSSKKAVGDSLSFNLEFINRSNAKVILKKLSCNSLNFLKEYDLESENNQKHDIKSKVKIPNELNISQPYWLVEKPLIGTCIVDDQLKIGKPENDPAASFIIHVNINGEEIRYKRPLIFKWNDPVKGEQFKNWILAPKVTANISKKVMIFSNDRAKNIDIKLKSHSGFQSGKIDLLTPLGWQVTGPNDYELNSTDDEISITYEVKPLENAISGNFNIMLDGVKAKSFKSIEYDHIPTQRWFPNAELELVKLDIDIPKRKIGYLMGAGDLVSDYLENIAYPVTALNANEINLEELNKYDVIITGVRFFNVEERAPYITPLLLEFVNQGGNLIVQYNTSYRLKTDNFSPFPLKISRDRVTEENAKVKFLKPNHKVLNSPNKVTKLDFENWVQERGLYFPNMWSKEYQPILSWNDTGEDAKDGSLLIAKYGKGYYTYTGISFFRQLPQGVSGAYRLLVNLISLSDEK